MSQVWLITGSFRGLGRAFTEAILAAGHCVLAAARNPDQLADLRSRYGDKIHTASLDVTSENRPYTPLFKQVYGQDAFQVFSPKQIYELFGEAIAAYESSGELCAFSSKYDASKYGTPPKNLYKDNSAAYGC
jgi:NAD(P)-dependent dehydrogenase (short-subunit alcohol dehydrogenase family)